jgi:hypothetical protein
MEKGEVIFWISSPLNVYTDLDGKAKYHLHIKLLNVLRTHVG